MSGWDKRIGTGYLLAATVCVFSAAISGRAAAQLDVAPVPGRLSPDDPNVWLSPFDNPVLRGTLQLDLGNGGGMAADWVPFAWAFDGFDPWGAFRCTAGDALCMSLTGASGNRLVPWPVGSGPGPLQWVANGPPMPIEFHSIYLGSDEATFFGHWDLDNSVPGDPPVSELLNAVKIKPELETLVVPLNVVVVLPAASMPNERSVMASYTNPEVMRALFDNEWQLGDYVRAPSGHLDRIGSWRVLSAEESPTERPGLRTVRTVNVGGGTLSSVEFEAGYLPDDIWVQCGIQFRMKQMVVIEESDPWYVRRLRGQWPNDTGTCSGAGAIGCGTEGALTQHFKEAATPQLDDPSIRTVIFNYRIHSPPCIYTEFTCCTDFDLGVTCGNDIVIDVSLQQSSHSKRRYTLSHELGHTLLAESGHSDDSTHCQPTTPNLMCGRDSASPISAHMTGCERRKGMTVSPLPTNCAPVPGDAKPKFTCDDARATVGGGPADVTPPVVDAGADQTVECTSPSGATVTLTASATDPETGIIGNLIWSVPMGPAPAPSPIDASPTTATAPIGPTTYQVSAANGASLVGTDAVTVTVTDTTPPVPSPVTGITVNGCQTSNVITLTAPAATDVCSTPADVHVTGSVIQSNGIPLVPPTTIPTSGAVTLPPGSYVIRWTAVDHAGLSASVDQTVDVAACLSVGQSMAMGDRSQLFDAGGQSAILLNYGAGTVDVNFKAKVGSIVSGGPVVLRDQAVVSGTIRTAATVTQIGHPTVTGPITEHATLALPPPPTITNPWPTTNKGPVTLEPNQSKSITPGTYTTVNVKTGAKLTLGAGTYFMDSLYVEPQSTVKLGGATTIEIRNTFIHRGAFRNNANALAPVAIRYRGTASIPMEAAFIGSVLAPNATLTMGISGALEFHGQFFARRIELRPDVRLFAEVPAAGSGFVATSGPLPLGLATTAAPAPAMPSTGPESGPKLAPAAARGAETSLSAPPAETDVEVTADNNGVSCSINVRYSASASALGALLLLGYVPLTVRRRRKRPTHPRSFRAR